MRLSWCITMAKWPTTKRKVVTLLATLCLFYLLWKEWNVFCYIPRSIIISYYYLSLFDFVFVIYIIYLVIRLDIYIRIYAKNNWTMNYFLWVHFCKDSLWPSYLPSEIIILFCKKWKAQYWINHEYRYIWYRGFIIHL